MFGGRRSRSAGRRTRRGGMNRIVVPGVLTGALLMHGPKVVAAEVVNHVAVDAELAVIKFRKLFYNCKIDTKLK